MNHEGNILHGGPPLFSLTHVFKVKLSVLAALFHHLNAILTSIYFILFYFPPCLQSQCISDNFCFPQLAQPALLGFVFCLHPHHEPVVLLQTPSLIPVAEASPDQTQLPATGAWLALSHGDRGLCKRCLIQAQTTEHTRKLLL